MVIENCTACHSTKIILQNGMTRERWDEMITWMQEKQGLWKLENGVREKILDYLAGTQGPGTKAVKKNPSKPEQSRMYRFDYPPNPL
ncbi:MAG: hypothetical protein VYC17_03880 [Nitrospinota bacterium]|nr:hypothetical protein [Nitrospinota bacterium]